jgi:hypothetical protein
LLTDKLETQVRSFISDFSRWYYWAGGSAVHPSWSKAVALEADTLRLEFCPEPNHLSGVEPST